MSHQRIVITLRPRPWWGRALRAPRHFWQVYRLGASHIPWHVRLRAAVIMTALLIRGV